MVLHIKHMKCNNIQQELVNSSNTDTVCRYISDIIAAVTVSVKHVHLQCPVSM